MKHITPLRDDEPTDAELARKAERPNEKRPRRDDPVMRDPTPEQIRSAH